MTALGGFATVRFGADRSDTRHSAQGRVCGRFWMPAVDGVAYGHEVGVKNHHESSR